MPRHLHLVAMYELLTLKKLFAKRKLMLVEGSEGRVVMVVNTKEGRRT